MTPHATPWLSIGSDTRLTLAGVLANTAVGTLFAWSLVADDAAHATGLSPRGSAAVFAGAIVVFTLCLLGTGAASRWIAPRALLIFAGAAGGSGLLLAALWSHPLALWSGVAALFGLAGGVAYSVATAMASRVERSRRGVATGLVVAAYAAGPVLLGMVGPPLLTEHGWRAGIVSLALVVAGLLLVAGWLAPSTAPPTDQSAVRADGNRAAPHATALLWLVFVGAAAPALMVFANAVPLADGRGLDTRVAGLAVSALAGGNLLGRLCAGWLADRRGSLPSLAAALTLAGFSLIGLAGTDIAPGLLGCFTGLGVSYGAVSALIPVATADLVGTDQFPRTYGRVFTAWGAAGLAAPVAGARLVERTQDTPAIFGLALLPLLPAGVALLALFVSSRHRARVGIGSSPT